MPKLTNIEIEKISNSLKLRLPRLYYKLLLEVGYGRVGDNAEIYHPSLVRELYEPFFDDPTQLFNPYFPFGCQNKTQELWIIDSKHERAASISHETVPDDWPDEEWLEYHHWIEKYLATELGCGS